MQVYPLRNIDFTLNFLDFNTTVPKLKTMNKSHVWVPLTPNSYVRYGVIKSDKKYVLNAEDWNEKANTRCLCQEYVRLNQAP